MKESTRCWSNGTHRNMNSPKGSEFAHSFTHKSVRATARKLNAHVLSYFSRHEGDLLRRLRQGLQELCTLPGRHLPEQIQSWKKARHFFDTNAVDFHARFLKALERCLTDEIQTIHPNSDRRQGQVTQPADFGAELNLSLVGVNEMDQMLLQDELIQHFNLRYEEPLAMLTLRLRALFGREGASLDGNPYRPEVLMRAFTATLKDCSFDEQSAQNAALAFDAEHCIDLGPLYFELEQMLERAGVAAQSHRVRKSRASGRTSGPAVTGEAFVHSAQSPLGLPPGSSESASAGGQAGYLEGDLGGYRVGPGGGLPPGVAASAQMLAYGYGAPVWSVATHAREFLRHQGMSPDGAGVLRDVGSAPRELWSAPGLVAAPVALPIEPYLARYLEALRVDAVKSFSNLGLDADLDSHNLLREMRADDEIRSGHEFDRGTVDALAEVFDFVFSDPDIAVPLKVMIGRLQIPVLKAALMDRHFFIYADHPARKLVDTLAAAAIAWTVEQGMDDPLYLQIEGAVKRVLTGFGQDLTLLTEVLTEFKDFLNAAEQQVNLQVQQLASAHEADEALEVARAQVDAMLQERILAMPDGHDTTAFLIPFLTDQWREVLAQAYVHHDAQPEAWTHLIETTDRLLWSTQHKRDSAERRELVTVLPGLVRQLNASLDALEWTGDERENFTRRLIATHMNAIRSGPDPTHEGVPDSEDRIASDNAVWMLDQRVAAARDAESDSYDSMLGELERGMWFDFISDQAQIHRCRLTWVSPKRKRFLFSNREGFDAFVRSEREIGALLRQGGLKALPREPLVSRAIDHIMAPPEIPVGAHTPG